MTLRLDWTLRLGLLSRLEAAVKLDQQLIDAAAALLEERFPEAEGIAAAMYTATGRVLTSVYFEPDFGGGGLCAETGAICAAETLDDAVTASACVSRLSAGEPVVVLTPCGICQERLFHWGGDIEVAVPDPEDHTRWQTRTLDEVQPYHWVKVFRQDS